MVKYLLNSFLFLLFLTALSFAKIDLAKLQKEYGKDLTKAPFFLRFDYFKRFNKPWDKTYFEEREYFLNDYEVSVQQEKAKELREDKLEAIKEKQRLEEKKTRERQEKERIKARLAKEKAEKRADEQRQKDLDMAQKEQERKLEEMKRAASQGF